jgi:hypothetical protein
VSSAVLYLAIVAVWAVVLVPMWLRRDTDPARTGFSWLPHRRAPALAPATAALAEEAPQPYEDIGVTGDDLSDDLTGDEPARPARRRVGRGGRGAVIARRRRRTLGLSLLVLGCAAAVIAGLAPFWVALPAIGLLAGHLSLLRVAVAMDAVQREEAALARAAVRAAARAEARAAQEAKARYDAAQAEIIDLIARNRARDVFDQYAHERNLRAVGD